MRIRTPGDIVYTFIAWTPILAFFAAVVWVACVALTSLEAQTTGSEVFISNRDSPSISGFERTAQMLEDLQ